MSPRRAKPRVGRPRETDRSKVRGELVTLKLTRVEHATLLRLVAERERELRAASHGARVGVTVSSYLRDLIARAAERKGLT